MTAKDTKPGAGKPIDDPWERIARANRGEDMVNLIVGDTGQIGRASCRERVC